MTPSTSAPSASSLSDRDGLADDVAYLRASYPPAQWRAHANFGELGAFWLHVHATLRGEAGEVSALVGSLRAGGIDPDAAFPRFVPAFNGFLRHLDAHHRIEDEAYFPRFRMLDARMVRGFDLLEADHVLIERTLHAAVGSARAMLAAQAADDRRRLIDRHAGHLTTLRRMLDRHLSDEEEIVIPALLEHGERSLGV